ncbi:MAG: T9SS type A sorting domain-containing protein, partial [Ignavibacteriaceae bacterium]
YIVFFITFVSGINAQSNIAVINLDSTHQVIRGFGAANILPWRPDMTTDQINKAFGTGDGQIGFTILRLRVPNQQNEFSLNVPTAKLAYSMGVTIIASPWSPPAWMKSNETIVSGRLNDTSYASYALHLKSFVDYMASNDVPLYAISVQNEPDVHVGYESCDWTAGELLKFVKENAAVIGTNIIVPESADFDKSFSDPILNDSAAAANVSIIGGHIYGGGLESYPLAESKGKEIWMTEYLNLGTDWGDNIGTGKEINDCMNAGMSTYIWWYIVRFYGPIDEDGSVSKRGYVMSQYARFVRPGFFRVDATANPQADVYVTAYKDSNKIVIVAINNSSSTAEQTFTLQKQAGIKAAMFTPYVTSGTKDCIKESNIALNGNSFTVVLDASSITTFVSEETPNAVRFLDPPQIFNLSQNYPNPFNPVTNIEFQTVNSGPVVLKVFDILGKEVATLINEEKPAGSYTIKFIASALPSGVYFYRLQSGSYSATKKLLLLK